MNAKIVVTKMTIIVITENSKTMKTKWEMKMKKMTTESDTQTLKIFSRPPTISTKKKCRLMLSRMTLRYRRSKVKSCLWMSFPSSKINSYNSNNKISDFVNDWCKL